MIKRPVPKNARVIAICVFRNGNRILVFEGFDSVKGLPFFRPIGGAVEFGELSQEAIERETREETGLEATDFKLLGVLESIFIYEGRQHHEIVFVYDGRFIDQTVYQRESLEIHEDNGDFFPAVWRDMGFFDEHNRLVPEKLADLLK
jgi:8-oxo-dGTP pyrophosphatase MutT (NUDIX family)